METIYLEHSTSKNQIIKAKPCVIALGFFDGVHLGHQRLIQTAKKIAVEKSVPVAVMTFYPHPRKIINLNNAPMKYLTPLYRKQDVLKSMGIDKLYVVKFDPIFACLSPEEFVEQYLINLGCLHIVAGFDYTYGYKGKGNIETLRIAGEGRFDVTVVNKISYNKEKISSTIIRQLISQGEMEVIPKYLGSVYKVNGNIARSLLVKNGMQELVIRINGDYLLPDNGEYHIQLNCHNLVYSGAIQKILIREDYSLLYVYIFEDFNLSVGNPVIIKWIKAVTDTKTDTKNEVNESKINNRITDFPNVKAH